jgi:hypothetical protein
MRTTRFLPFLVCIATMGAGLVPVGSAGASLFSAAVGGTSDQDAFAAETNGGFIDNYSTGAWTGSAFAGGSGAGAQLALAAGNTSTYQFVCGQNACTYVTASANTSDIMRITPTGLAPAGTPIDVRFDLVLDGSIVGNGGWSVQASGSAGNGPGVGYGNGTGGTVGAYNLAVHEVMSFTRTLLVGTNYSLNTSLSLGALMRGIGPQPFGIDVDILDTLTIQGFVLSQGVGPLQMIGDSGRDYLVAPVPAPAAGWLLLSGVSMFMALHRRRLPNAEAA